MPRQLPARWPRRLGAKGDRRPRQRLLVLRRLALLAANKRFAAWWRLRRHRRGRPGGRAAATAPDRAPAFDLKAFNPIHWPREACTDVAALGPLHRLPPGVIAHRALRGAHPLRLRRFHHVEDVQAFHGDVVARAGELARLAAAGVVVHIADSTPRLAALLGAELHALMTADVASLDAAGRELHSIAMRRATLRTHSTWARAPANLPPVSIVLATRRPALLSQALEAVASQTWPRLELVLAPHGDARAFAGIEGHIAGLGLPVTVVPAPASAPLGAVLNAAVQASSGTLVTKMDDDDRYGPDHVWDLALAHAYSGARLVCKGFEFVYLAGLDRTLHCHRGRGEAWRASCFAGGTLTIARDDLDALGGWRNAPSGVDWALVLDVLRAGGGVYRTHGAGFMLMRHGHGHTWGAHASHFLARAQHTTPGFRPGLAGLAEAHAPAPGERNGLGPPPPAAQADGAKHGMPTV